MILTFRLMDSQHSVTIPRHRTVNTGTLDAVVSDVADFLRKPKKEVRETLFG